jgi:hypothetical protein
MNKGINMKSVTFRTDKLSQSDIESIIKHRTIHMEISEADMLLGLREINASKGIPYVAGSCVRCNVRAPEIGLHFCAQCVTK